MRLCSRARLARFCLSGPNARAILSRCIVALHSVAQLFCEFPNLVVLNLVVCKFYAKTLFCALLRPFALFCELAFALFCGQLRSFALICVFLRPTAFRATPFRNCRVFQHLEGCRRRIALKPPSKGPVAPIFSALEGGVALQAASWKMSRYPGCSSYTVACHAAVGHLGFSAFLRFSLSTIDKEFDHAIPPYNGNDPSLPLVV